MTTATNLGSRRRRPVLNATRPWLLLALFGVALTLAGAFLVKPGSVAAAVSPPGVQVIASDRETVAITVTFPQAVGAGNIADFELSDSANQRVWQAYSTTGGSTFIGSVRLTPGSYALSVGLFSAEWTNYAWFDRLFAFTFANNYVSTLAPRGGGPDGSMSLFAQAMSAYGTWKAKYLQPAGPGMLRTVRPEGGNDTVSEGVGYGMLASVLVGDRSTLDQLWSYAQQYLDGNGLMHWDIAADGNVLGAGSAADADQDMAYALWQASRKWPDSGYEVAASTLTNAILKTEVSSSNLITPGDSWGNTTVVNPSYIAPGYYRPFARFTGESRWNEVADASSNWLLKAADPNTGLLPDWLNADFTEAPVPWDARRNDFSYDASRVPIRLLFAIRTDSDARAQMVLQRQAAFFGAIGVDSLRSGYTLAGAPLGDYLDPVFLSAYAAAGQVSPGSNFGQASLSALIASAPSTYFATTLRLLVLLLLTQPL